MKKIIVIAMLSFLATYSYGGNYAEEGYLGAYGIHDVVVPSIWGTPSSGELIQGMIFFDASTATLKFVGNSAIPIAIAGATGGNVISAGPNERVERLTIAQGANCSSSPCTITRWSGPAPGTSGSWITNVTRTAAGTYVLNFAADAFNGAPTCVCLEFQGQCVSSATAPSAASFGFQTANAAGTLADSRDINIICMGERQ